MSTSKRRLSKGAKTALPLQEDDQIIDEDLNIQSNSRRNSFARRRHSIGKICPSPEEAEESLQEQNRIAEMYKSIIKMSSENKINAKNSWNLDLINHMDKMIKIDERSASKGVNFQKASCTLDASIKIYSHRVDDTWSSSYRILENLSRNEHFEEDDIEADDEDNDSGEQQGRKKKKASRVGSKSTSNKLNLVMTIEKNIKNLNLPDKENSISADPMFHKMSQAFDEGGAKGMLMSNLKVSPLSSTIMFSTLGHVQDHDDERNVIVTEHEGAKGNNSEDTNSASLKSNMLAASERLLSRSGLRIEDLLSKSVCSSLSGYRKTLGISTSNTHTNFDFSAPLHHRSNTDQPHENTSCEDYDEENDMPFSDNDESNEDASSEQATLTAEALATLGYTANRRSSGSSDNMTVYSSASKIQWDSVYDGDDDSASVASSHYADRNGSGPLSINDANPIGFQLNKQKAVSTAAFLAMNSGGSNQWAGAKHWRRSTRRKAASVKPSTDAPSKKERKPSKQKQKFLFDFFNIGEGVSENINVKFEKLKGSRKLNPTLISDTVLQKGIMQAEEGLYTLPANARLNVKDLCRLFHWSSMIVPPANSIDSITKEICAPSALSHRYAGMEGDQLLRMQIAIDQRRDPANQNVESDCDDAFCNDDANPTSEWFDDDNDDDDNYYPNDSQPPNFDNKISSELEDGLRIEVAGGLLEAPRKIKKIDVSYAQSSKRVNVKKLKSDLWTKLEDECGEIVKENNHPAEDMHSHQQKELSFQDVVGDIAEHQTQKDASLSFYFICLLHLANEKNLCIKDTPTMDDLFISRGKSM